MSKPLTAPTPLALNWSSKLLACILSLAYAAKNEPLNLLLPSLPTRFIATPPSRYSAEIADVSSATSWTMPISGRMMALFALERLLYGMPLTSQAPSLNRLP